jgi:hypothetical protein
VPAGQQSVGPGVEAGSQDDRLAHPVVGRAAEEVVEEPGAHRDLLSPGLTVEQRVILEIDLPVDDADEGIRADGADQRIGQRIVEQRIGSLRRHGAGCRDHGGRRSHAGRRAPAVTVGASRFDSHPASSYFAFLFSVPLV